VYHVAVAVATAVETLDIEMKNICVCQRGHNSKWQCHVAHIAECVVLLGVGCKEVDKTFGGHLTAYLYENCVLLFM
jgi:hypothetical protein